MPGWEGAFGDFHHVAKQALEASAVDAQVSGLTYALVYPRRALSKRELPGPNVRLSIAIDREATLFNLSHGIGGRGFNPVDLT